MGFSGGHVLPCIAPMRPALAVTGIALTALAAVTGCTSADTAPAPSSSAGSAYLQELHGMAAKSQVDVHQLLPGRTPDARLVSAGQEACADLEHRTPRQVVTQLEQDGWPQWDAAIILLSAAQPNALCPDKYQTVMQSWMGSN